MRHSPFTRFTLMLLLVAVPAFVGTPGSFRGRLVEGAKPGWICVESRNNMLRMVNVTRATIHYADEIPASQRLTRASDSLKPGAEVRVTARDDGRSRWKAEEVEILALAPTRRAQK